jgi:uncharacterized FlaG/YvyC family protein
MSDTIQLVPSVPVVARPVAVRPDQHVEPAKQAHADNRPADNGNESPQNQQQNLPNRHLTISRHDTLGTFIYRSVDEDSGKVVWQYPSESILRTAQHLQALEAQKADRHVDKTV